MREHLLFTYAESMGGSGGQVIAFRNGDLQAMIGSPGTKAAPGVSFGVQGYVEALPPAFSQAVVLLGRKGISATQMAWGETVRRHAGTKRLTLDKDVLNSKVTYWTDNASARPPFLLPMPSILKVLCNF